MKKQAEQKTKGHKAKDDSLSQVPSTVQEPLSKEKINSLKDKNMAKGKRRR